MGTGWVPAPAPEMIEGEDRVLQLLDEIDRAVELGLYQLAVAAALAIPDVAGALEAPGGWAKNELAWAWFDREVSPRLRPEITDDMPARLRDHLSGFEITGENFYRFRCSLLHQGTLEDGSPLEVKTANLSRSNLPNAPEPRKHRLEVELGCVRSQDAWQVFLQGKLQSFATVLCQCEGG